jgi:hypothetical protein
MLVFAIAASASLITLSTILVTLTIFFEAVAFDAIAR